MSETIYLHKAAPPKPVVGAACNGCGVCCALETCPAARLRYLQKKGPCPALLWSESLCRYECGFLVSPQAYFPGWLVPVVRIGIERSIAAGKGCDCSVEPAGSAHA